MIKLSSIKLDVDKEDKDILMYVAEKLHIDKSEIMDLKLLKRSLEARKKERLCFVYSVLVRVKDENKVLKYISSKKGKDLISKHQAVFVEKEDEYIFPCSKPENANVSRPIIVGCGPAGLLCGYELAKAGFNPLLIERGSMVEERTKKVRHFWNTNQLDTKCNVQFGEGGAGTFSDGKLNTGVNDKFNRKKEVLDLFVSCGAPCAIKYDAMPHIGSDILEVMVANLRKEIISLGGQFIFDNKVSDIEINNGAINKVILENGQQFESDCVVIAIGHSARDTFKMLYGKGLNFIPKSFAVGVRAEHDQEIINVNQWGVDYPKSLGAAAYKLTYKADNGRSVYTFCMCPGGIVVNASSEDNMIAVNGMSLSKRDSRKANSAVIVSVTPEDFDLAVSNDVPAELRGIEYQRMLESKAYNAGKGYIPVSYLKDLKNGTVSDSSIEDVGSHEGKTKAANLRDVLPDYVWESLIEGIEAFDKKIKGFSKDDTLLYAVESRTSSPVRIVRSEENYQSNIAGIFPCGEGAGYAGGIMSAAMDGIKVAEACAKFLIK